MKYKLQILDKSFNVVTEQIVNTDRVTSNKRSWELAARRQLRGIKKELIARGFEVSPIRFNPGGSAVMGECMLYAKRPREIRGWRDSVWYVDDSIFVMACHSLTAPGTAEILYRFEQWPEFYGGEKSHKRMGPNHYTGFFNPNIEAIVSASREFNQSY